ncbi:MAG: TetR/AcrR family transcriptional regulator [Methyloligellaceae bacterium]
MAEDMCARLGPTRIKLADIASELGIEAPSIYRHFQGLAGVIAALGEVSLKAEIETFDGTEKLPFDDALELQAGRCFDLYIARPGLARFLMVDLAVPGGVHVFDGNQNLDLIRELFALERDLLQRGVQEGAVRPMNLTTFIAAKLGPTLAAIALTDLQAPGSDTDFRTLKTEYLKTLTAGLRPQS